jgi:hypothetical protein
LHRGAPPKVNLRGQDLRLNTRTENDSKFRLNSILHSPYHRGGKGREETARVFLFLWSIHHNFSGDSNSEYATVAVQARFLDKDTKNSFLVIVYSALFYIVIEALNLVL